MIVEERLGWPTGDDAGALVLQEGRRVAFEDLDGVGEAFEDEGGEEATEGAADLGVRRGLVSAERGI